MVRINNNLPECLRQLLMESGMNITRTEISSDPSQAFLHANDFLEHDSNVSKEDLGLAFYRLGKVHYDKSDLDEAEINFAKALQCTERPRDTFTSLKVLGFLIRISSEKLNEEKAKAYIAQTEELIDELTSALGSLNAEYFYNVSVIKNYRGDFAAARDNILIAYKKSKEENEPEMLAKCLLSLANNSFNVRDYDKALEYLAQLVQLLKIIDKSYLQGSMYILLGKIYTEKSMFDKSLVAFGEANKHLQEKKCWNLYGYVLLGRGTVYKRLGEFNKAMIFFQLASEAIDPSTFKRLGQLVSSEIEDVNDSSVDLYLDRTNRKVMERSLGTIDFKHRFVLLEILFLLAKNTGSYFDKEILAKQIWKDEYNPLIHDKLIYTSVSRLRKLIEPSAASGEKRKYIIRGKDGYTFNPNVKIRFHRENKETVGSSIANIDINSPV